MGGSSLMRERAARERIDFWPLDCCARLQIQRVRLRATVGSSAAFENILAVVECARAR